VTLAELVTEIRSEEVRALAELPAELSVSFEKIFEAAGIAPPAGGWTIDRLRELLLGEKFKDRERTDVQKIRLETLAADKVQVEDLVKEAVARDTALDAYEKFVRGKMEHRKASRERRVAEIESRIQELEDEKKSLKEKGREDEEQWRAWRRQKQAAEKNLAWTVGYLIDKQVITTDEDTS
jgi:hypothetical protein